MFEWKDYYVEREKRQDQVSRVEQYRTARDCRQDRQSAVTRIYVRFLNSFGSQLIRWGEQLQCRCGEMLISTSKRSTSLKI
jgi:hypothetical protein